MALINCKECGKEISDKATSCPNCGYKLKETTAEKELSVAKTVAIVIIIGLGAIFLYNIISVFI